MIILHPDSSTFSWWLYILYPSSDYDATYYEVELLLLLLVLLLLLLLLIGALVKIAQPIPIIFLHMTIMTFIFVIKFEGLYHIH